MGAAADAVGQPHAFAAFFVGNRAGGVEVHGQVVGVGCRGKRISRIPVVCGAEADLRLVDGFPALLQVASLVDADAPEVVGSAVVPASDGEATCLLADAHLAGIGATEKAYLFAAFVGDVAAGNGGGVVLELVAGFFSQLFDERFEFVHL